MPNVCIVDMLLYILSFSSLSIVLCCNLTCKTFQPSSCGHSRAVEVGEVLKQKVCFVFFSNFSKEKSVLCFFCIDNRLRFVLSHLISPQGR